MIDRARELRDIERLVAAGVDPGWAYQILAANDKGRGEIDSNAAHPPGPSEWNRAVGGRMLRAGRR
jgi:hypothetical protein